MLVCSENFIQFGSSMDNWGSTCPYYSLDSCCAIQDILEMVSDLSFIDSYNFLYLLPFQISSRFFLLVLWI